MRLLLALPALLLAGCAGLADLLPEALDEFRGCSVQAYALGSQRLGTLEDTDCAIQGGRRIDYYEFRLTAAQRVAVRVGSDDFDTFLYLYTCDGREIASNDDITPFLNTDSRVTQQLEPGRYIIGVTAASASGLGRYSLTSELRN